MALHGVQPGQKPRDDRYLYLSEEPVDYEPRPRTPFVGNTLATKAAAVAALERAEAGVEAMSKLVEREPFRTFETGATRDLDDSKPDYEAFLSPLVLEAYGRYMHAKRRMADGSLRDGDNWQKGIPQAAYMKSGWRHMMDWWKLHRGLKTADPVEDVLCALLFNVMGYLHERLKA